jgi:hypothetical protein
LRQKKFVIPTQTDIYDAAQFIVSAEELRIHRSAQAVPLKKLWFNVVKSERRNQKNQKNATPDTRAPQMKSVSSESWEIAEASGLGSFMFDDDVSFKLLAIQGAPVNQRARRRQHPRPRYLPSLGTRGAHRYLSGLQVAAEIHRPEWNGSSTLGVPKWYAAPHNPNLCARRDE